MAFHVHNPSRRHVDKALGYQRSLLSPLHDVGQLHGLGDRCEDCQPAFNNSDDEDRIHLLHEALPRESPRLISVGVFDSESSHFAPF